MWRADAPAFTNRTSLAWAAKPGLGTSACYLPTKHHHALVMLAQPAKQQVQISSKHTGSFRSWDKALINVFIRFPTPWTASIHISGPGNWMHRFRLVFWPCGVITSRVFTGHYCYPIAVSLHFSNPSRLFTRECINWLIGKAASTDRHLACGFQLQRLTMGLHELGLSQLRVISRYWCAIATVCHRIPKPLVIVALNSPIQWGIWTRLAASLCQCGKSTPTNIQKITHRFHCERVPIIFWFRRQIELSFGELDQFDVLFVGVFGLEQKLEGPFHGLEVVCSRRDDIRRFRVTYDNLCEKGAILHD